MGLLGCCFAAPAVDEVSDTALKHQKWLPAGAGADDVPVEQVDSLSVPAAAKTDLSKSWSQLNVSETAAVKHTLHKVRPNTARVSCGR